MKPERVASVYNLAYKVLSWKVHKALINAKLEPFLGYLHNAQFGKSSLVYDFQKLYHYLIDDFLIKFCQSAHIDSLWALSYS